MGTVVKASQRPFRGKFLSSPLILSLLNSAGRVEGPDSVLLKHDPMMKEDDLFNVPLCFLPIIHMAGSCRRLVNLLPLPINLSGCTWSTESPTHSPRYEYPARTVYGDAFQRTENIKSSYAKFLLPEIVSFEFYYFLSNIVPLIQFAFKIWMLSEKNNVGSFCCLNMYLISMSFPEGERNWSTTLKRDPEKEEA